LNWFVGHAEKYQTGEGTSRYSPRGVHDKIDAKTVREFRAIQEKERGLFTADDTGVFMPMRFPTRSSASWQDRHLKQSQNARRDENRATILGEKWFLRQFHLACHSRAGQTPVPPFPLTMVICLKRELL